MAKLSANSASHLRKYLVAGADIQDLYDFLIGAEYDPGLPSSERDALSAIRTIALDVTEGRCPKSDLEQAIRPLLKKPAPSRAR